MKKIVITREQWDNLKWIDTKIKGGDTVEGKIIEVRQQVAEMLGMHEYGEDQNWHKIYKKDNDLYVLRGFNGGTCLYAKLPDDIK